MTKSHNYFWTLLTEYRAGNGITNLPPAREKEGKNEVDSTVLLYDTEVN